MSKITEEIDKDKENIEEIVSDVEPMDARNDDYDESDHHYKSRNARASDMDKLKFI